MWLLLACVASVFMLIFIGGAVLAWLVDYLLHHTNNGSGGVA